MTLSLAGVVRGRVGRAGRCSLQRLRLATVVQVRAATIGS